MLRPKQITEQLGISPATLRLWSNHFSEFLSPGAQATLTEKGTPAQRRYSEEDRALFVRAKSLLDLGLTYEQVKEALAQPSQALEVIRTNGALANAPTRTTEPHNGPAELAELVALFKRQVELQEQILLKLETRPPTPLERILTRLGF